MPEIDLSRAGWHKSSSYSSQSGNCVEVARNLPGSVAVRDSKAPEGPKLLVSPETWQAFLLTLRARDAAKSLNEAVSCCFIAAGDVSGVSADGRRARAERWKFSR